MTNIFIILTTILCSLSSLALGLVIGRIGSRPIKQLPVNIIDGAKLPDPEDPGWKIENYRARWTLRGKTVSRAYDVLRFGSYRVYPPESEPPNGGQAPFIDFEGNDVFAESIATKKYQQAVWSAYMSRKTLEAELAETTKLLRENSTK